MRKYALPALMALLALLVVQWWRADHRLDRLRLLATSLDYQLQMIEAASANLPALEDQRRETTEQVRMLRNKLPAAAETESFSRDFTSLCHERGLTLDLVSEVTLDRELYEESIMTFSYQEAWLDKELPGRVLQDMDRLARWSSNAADRRLVVHIYSMSYAFTLESVQSCSDFNLNSGNYWPFSGQLKVLVGEVTKKCRQRDRNREVLAQINDLKRKRELHERLRAIVFNLSSLAAEDKVQRQARERTVI